MGSNPTGPTTNKSATSGIVEYLFHLQKEGYKEQTISSCSTILRFLAKNLNLRDPESVKEFVPSRRVSNGRKENLINAYSNYAKFLRISFSAPRYVREDSLPFIPLEAQTQTYGDCACCEGMARLGVKSLLPWRRSRTSSSRASSSSTTTSQVLDRGSVNEFRRAGRTCGAGLEGTIPRASRCKAGISEFRY